MRILFAGTSSDVGKTTVVLGVMRALRNRGLKVQGYKAGPDYIDTAFHTFATGVPSRNLDTWMFNEKTIHHLIGKHSHQTDISIMEGVMGMFDGAGVASIEGSSAHLAKVTKTPVILIINGAGVALSAAAMVLGFKNFDPDIEVKGVIVNKVSGEHHYNLIKEAVELHVGIPCLGYLKKNEAIALKSRHLGLIPSVEVKALDQKIDEVAMMIEETVDLDTLMAIANSAKSYDFKESTPVRKHVRLGVAKDDAFNFYYQDNLDLLEDLGCELIYFSPVKDQVLPNNLDGLYIGGGFPEIFGKELEANKKMRAAIKSSIEAGLPTYAECGGLMYLTDSIKDLKGKVYKMCGIFETKSEMTERLQRFGYVNVTLNKDTIIGGKGTNFKAHEFHRSVVVEDEQIKSYASYDIEKTRKKEMKWQCGYMKYNCLGGYPHIHFYNNIEVAKQFVKTCKNYQIGVKHEA